VGVGPDHSAGRHDRGATTLPYESGRPTHRHTPRGSVGAQNPREAFDRRSWGRAGAHARPDQTVARDDQHEPTPTMLNFDERGSDRGADHMPADASVSSGAESRPSVERALAITRKAGAASNCWPWALGRSLYGVGTDSPTLSEDRLARPQNDSNDMMDAAEVAELLGVPTGWVYEQSRKGLIPGRAWPLPALPPLVAGAVDRGTGEQPAVQRGRPQPRRYPVRTGNGERMSPSGPDKDRCRRGLGGSASPIETRPP
jgi:hypothetical protein